MELTQDKGGKSSSGSKRDLSDQDMDRMIDAYFDRELSTNQRRQMFDQLSGKQGRCEDIARMQRILAQLRQPVEPIDICDEVIDQIDDRRRFLSPAMRSVVRWGRMGVAASVLLALLGIVVAQRLAPSATILGTETTPVTSLMQDSSTEFSQIKSNLASVPEQAIQALAPHVSRFANVEGTTTELTIEVGDFAAKLSNTDPHYPAIIQQGILIPSGAGGETFVAIWQPNIDEGAPRGFALETAFVSAQGFRPVESRLISFDLSEPIQGEHARTMPLFVEHFEAGALPVSFDPEMFKGVLQLITREFEANKSSDDQDR